MLKYIAIGDAFGAPYEFQTPEFIDTNYKEHGFKYINREGKPTKGVYTDDTQMSLAVADFMTEDREELTAPTHKNFALKFITRYNMEPRKGYSRRTTAMLKCETAAELLELVATLQTKEGNGCVMRVLPIGLYPDIEKVKQVALVQATVTHQTVDCILASQAIALMAHYYYYGYDQNNTQNFWWWLNTHLGVGETNRVRDAYRSGRVENDAMTTASWVANVLTRNNKYTDVLHHALKTGGDVDSLCAIGLGLMSLKSIGENDLPKTLEENLEDGQFGRWYIGAMDKQLYSKFPRAKV